MSDDMMDEPERITFEIRRLPEYTDEAIVAELRRVSSLVPDGAFLESDFLRLGRVHSTTVKRRFGSWLKALDAAGLVDRATDNITVRQMPDEEMLEMLRNLAARLEKSTLTSADVNNNLPFSSKQLSKRWGTKRAAFEAAGLSASNLGRRYTGKECFDNLLSVWTHYRRPPKYLEMGLPPSQVGGKAYVNRFKTWNKALAAFVERVNRDSDHEDERKLEIVAVETGERIQSLVPIPRPSEESRDIRLGLRFRVLHRDRFKCVLCGDHPARNAECVLNVDHVIPWSKGGKTSEENLRTLCATCNVGRGNRFAN